jgi:Type I phosphodiesterase / nucleotide pyrophosphatase
MRYLRMLTNAIVAGVLGAIYLTVLVLQLNPHVPVVSMTALRWFWALLAMYGPYLSATIFLLILAREALASRPLYPGWLSLRILAWLSAAASVSAAVITWANLWGMRSVLGDGAAERMRQGASSLTVCASLLVGVALLRYSFGRRGNRPAVVLMVVSVSASILVPLWVRGPGETPVPATRRPNQARAVAQAPRVRMILIDGASKGFILERVASGQLPNFGTLLDRGARLDLATLRPTQVEPVWSAAATGKYPPKNGVRSDYVYRVDPGETEPVNLLPDYCFAQALLYQGFVREEPLTSVSLHARTMWEILGDYSVAAGIVNWPLTRAASIERGYLLSDYFDEARSSPIRSGDQRAGDPTTAVDIGREVFDRWQAVPREDILPLAGGEEQAPGIQRVRWDRAYLESESELSRLFTPRLTAVRLEAIDELGHAFLRQAQPELSDARRGDPRRSVLDRYYADLDLEIGRFMEQTAPGDLLLVVSGFGMERTPLVKRWFSRAIGEVEATGSHEAAPDGFLIAFGANVAAGEYRRGSIVDLAPTVLYYMGIPIGRDMDGFVRTDLFRALYTREHPVTYTLTHER